MESELEKFRQKKRREEYKTQVKGTFHQMWSSLTNSLARAVLPVDSSSEESQVDSGDDLEFHNEAPASNAGKVSKVRTRRRRGDVSDADSEVDSKKNETSPLITYLPLLLKILIWIFFYLGFLKLGFGAVYFVVSGLWFMWTNTRRDRRKKGEASAYSVFNPNCEALDGALNAEKLEKQLLFRS
jgi:hypothetical protein